MAPLDLLDSPHRASLNTRSTSLRTSIKEWERSFAAAHDGKKPTKNDIKANGNIAAKYKEFQKLGDVLAGKLGIEALQTPRKKQKPDTVRRRLYDVTPRKASISILDSHPSQVDPYDAPPSATPKRFLSAIGPTPQRDGKVLGLFDLLSNSGGSHGSKTTPGSNNKKRKVSALTETDGNVVAQTPSRKRDALNEDILQHLGSTNETPASAEKKFGRTPASDSKKFMLSHFFATPSAMRYADVVGDIATKDAERTPLRDIVLGLDSAEKLKDQAGNFHDTTPVFLRRSHSFKERLVSAKPGKQAVSPSAIRKVPSALRRYKSGPKPFSQIMYDLQNTSTQKSQLADDDDYNDEEDNDAMEAMRETENAVQVRETQQQELSDFEGQGESDLDDLKPVPGKEKIWKKKGQKRTTKRSNMKPARVKQAKAPKFVAAEESEDEESRIEETQIQSATVGAARSHLSDDDLQAPELLEPEQLLGGPEDSPDSFRPNENHEAPEHIPGPTNLHQKAKLSTEKEEPHAFKPKKSSRAPTINPNAISHQNFKTLKIRSKTAKAAGAGGRGKFTRKR